MRLNAYYYAFDPTGSEDIDRILSAVACAGKAYHHTENWTEDIAMPYEPSHRGGSCVEWIQNAANDAAANLAAARREGVIEGLEIALGLFPKPNSTTQWDPQDAIRAKIERLRGESWWAG